MTSANCAFFKMGMARFQREHGSSQSCAPSHCATFPFCEADASCKGGQFFALGDSSIALGKQLRRVGELLLAMLALGAWGVLVGAHSPLFWTSLVGLVFRGCCARFYPAARCHAQLLAPERPFRVADFGLV